MENIINILDEIENGRITDVDYVELLACVDGCVGGTFNVENPFIARNNIEHIINNTDDAILLNDDLEKFEDFYQQGVFDFTLSEDNHENIKFKMSDAVLRIEKIKDILSELPGLDCGSCGSPTCHSLAEDIYDNKATLDNCVVLRAESK